MLAQIGWNLASLAHLPFLFADDAPGAASSHGMLTQLGLKVTLVGAEWVLWLLLLLSWVSIGIIVERIWFFKVHNVNGPLLAEKLAKFLHARDFQGAWQLVAEEDNIECQVVSAGLVSSQQGAEACSEAMLSTKARERTRLDRNLAILGTIGSNAPFVGLLGTVLGIIKAAHDMGNQSGGSADPGAVMAGVFEALVATAAGLGVAIPAIVFFNGFQRRVKTTLSQVDSLAHLVLVYVQPKPRSSASPSSAPSAPPAPPQPVRAN